MLAHETLLSARVGVAKSQGGESPLLHKQSKAACGRLGNPLTKRGATPLLSNPWCHLRP